MPLQSEVAAKNKNNFLRHQFRTMLTGIISETTLNAIMGHEKDKQEVMHPLSSYQVSIHYEKAREAIQGLVDKLNLKQVEIIL
ncbi:MAG: hypothetical protein KGV46_03110 [Pasteurella sp.]|nr:hypothetical protein [Pasteurella sp.]